MQMFAARAALTVAAFGAMMATAAAAEPQGAYLRGDIGWSFGRDIGGSVIDGTGFEGDSGNTPMVELGVGYQLPYNLRVDVTGSFRPNYEINSKETFGGLAVNADADVRSSGLMANVYYDIPTGTAFTPYVGGGIGVAFNKVKTINYTFGAGQIREDGDSKTSLAWSLQGGVAYAVTSNMKIDLGYRYIDLGEFETSGNSTVGAVPKTDGDLRAHEVKIGLRYQF